jgi:hypothetical protein
MRSIKPILFGLALFFWFSSEACDICGNFMGLTPYNNRNSITLMHRYRVFNGYRDYQQQNHFFPASAYRVAHVEHTNDSLPESMQVHSSKDFESYKVFELRFKYFVHKRIELNTFLPVLSNRTKTNDVYTSHTGFGDVSVNAGFHVLLPDEEKDVKQKLVAGLGIKLPTGNYYAHDSKSMRLPFEMQPGTGSTDGFVYLNYILMYRKIGFNVNANLKVNGQNRYKEKVKNSTTDFLSVFYKVKCGNVLLYPSIQANYEYTKGLEIKKVIQPSMAVNALMIGPGLDVYYKSFSVNASWQFTTFEKVLPGDLESAGRLSLGLNYNFGGKTK